MLIFFRKNSLSDASSAADSEANVYEAGVLWGDCLQYGYLQKNAGAFPDHLAFNIGVR